MFNENSMQDQTAGQSEIREARAPVVSVVDQSNTEENPSPSVPAGATSLAWWDDMKYFWKRSANGGVHLAPQDSYVNDVLTEGDLEIQRASKDFLDEKSDDLKLATDELTSANQIIETRNAFDPSGIEAAAFIRQYRDRVVIARKIAGSAAVSANHRLQNAAATTGDTDAVKDTDFFKSDIENSKRWAFKACYFEFILSKLDGVAEVVPNIGEYIASGVGRALYDDAVERGNKLKRPAPAKQPSANKLSAEELRQLRA